MLLRFEDTDKERSKKEYEEDILQGLAWLGITYDRTVSRQSERTSIYRSYLTTLIQSGHAYEAEESTTERGKKVVRFKNPNIRITFQDLIRGDISFDTTELKDFIIARSMDEPLYHLAVVVDDGESGVTHVIRGEDHISNTQRQILILEALGFRRPVYAHIPLILAPNRTKLSKRNFAASVNDYRRLGYLPEAFVNYLALLGWTPAGKREKLPLADIVQEFEIENVHKSGAVFDLEKLKWLNRQYLLEVPDSAFFAEIRHRLPSWNENLLKKLLPLFRERVSVWSDVETLASEFDFFLRKPDISASALVGKGSSAEDAARHLTKISTFLMLLSDADFSDPERIKNAVWDYASEHGRGNVLWPFRVALSGKERSPDPFFLAHVLGKQETLSRIDSAARILQAP